MEDEWLKFKKYPHIGRPLSKRKDGNWITEYVMDSEKVAKHKFNPLLHRVLYQRKYRPEKNAGKTKTGKRSREIKERKERHIYFASHLDSIIYGYYSFLLTKAYENFLADKPFGNAVVAYRKIPIEIGKKGNKSNIEFAFEAFDFVEKNRQRELSIIVADVTAFFDNLNHRVLHSQWKKVLGVEDMPIDHYKVYKSLVAKRYVNENELFGRFKSSLLVERALPHNPTKSVVKRKSVNKIWNLRKEKVVAFCEEKDFFAKATDLIRVDKPYSSTLRKDSAKEPLKGIPQGTPISATLANIYMIDFDEKLNSAVNEGDRDAFYQRYSDDLIIVCDRADEEFFSDLLRQEIDVVAKLEIHPDKTKVYRYANNDSGIFQGGLLINGCVSQNKQLEYLGFEYNGRKVRVKTAGFSKFYRNLKRSFKRGVNFAKASHIPSEALFETRLYKRFTHLGSKRKRKYIKDDTSPTGYSKSKEYDWGNFISYLNKANFVMKAINGDDDIKKQYRKIWKNFHEIKDYSYGKIAAMGKAKTE